MKASWMAAGALALAALAGTQTAAAADVYWSVGVSGPGVMVIGNRPPPPPVVVVQQPEIYAPAPHYYRPPQPVYYPQPVVVYPGRPPHHHHDRWDDRGDGRWGGRDDGRWERHGHGRFEAHPGQRGGRDEYGDRWGR